MRGHNWDDLVNFEIKTDFFHESRLENILMMAHMLSCPDI